ncbi:MAG: ABC transporter permease [Pseudomonadota bacterium]
MRQVGSPALMWSLAGAVMAFLYLPIALVVLFSFNSGESLGLPFEGFSLRWYGEVLENRQILRAALNAFLVAIASTVVAVVFGLPTAIALDRYDFPGKSVFRRIVLLPIVLPGIITGVALLGFFVMMRIPLSLWTIILGLGTALICIVVTEVFARLQQVGRSQAEAARNLGANEIEIFFRVTLPAISSALIGAMLIAFSIALDELAITYLLTGRDNTLPMQLWSMLRRQVTPEINAIATLVVLVSLVLVTVGMVLSRGRGRRGP